MKRRWAGDIIIIKYYYWSTTNGYFSKFLVIHYIIVYICIFELMKSVYFPKITKYKTKDILILHIDTEKSLINNIIKLIKKQ